MQGTSPIFRVRRMVKAVGERCRGIWRAERQTETGGKLPGRTDGIFFGLAGNTVIYGVLFFCTF